MIDHTGTRTKFLGGLVYGSCTRAVQQRVYVAGSSPGRGPCIVVYGLTNGWGEEPEMIEIANGEFILGLVRRS